MVESIVGVDQARNLVYFMGTAASPLERHLYSSSLAPAEARQVRRRAAAPPRARRWPVQCA